MNQLTVKKTADVLEKIINELDKVLIGQREVIENLLIAFFAEGHVLLEGVPGLGKTLLVNALSHVIGGQFKRIQFTPDLMPSDIIGTTIYNAEIHKFQIKKGPVFTDLLLADEINRAPAKTQSALLQAMQERSVNIDGTNYDLGEFFICIATQNPIEMEGTYPLPEAQTDRFLMKLFIDYPELQDEQRILNSYREGFNPDNLKGSKLKKIIDEKAFITIKDFFKKVTVDDKIIEYITNIVHVTRSFSKIEVGSSPRGSVALFKASRIKAVLNGRDFVVPDDVKDLACHILRHRIILDADAEIEGAKPDDFIKFIIDKIEVPR